MRSYVASYLYADDPKDKVMHGKIKDGTLQLSGVIYRSPFLKRSRF